jgi:protein tyrosine/serine phosphatase
VVTERALAWDGCSNVRDLGGHPTELGGLTRYRAVVRAETPRRLTNAGWDALVDYGVRRIVDLRAASEIALDPPRSRRVEVIHVPLLPDYDHADWAELDALLETAGGTQEAALPVMYLAWLEWYGASFVEALRAVADAPDGAVVVHCEGGKDRTGLIAALLLRLAGVPVADIAHDYSLSEGNLRLGGWIDEAPTPRERELRALRIVTPADAMTTVLTSLEERHGDVGGFLADAGAAGATLDCVRARLVA